jgi:hypothetical protein
VIDELDGMGRDVITFNPAAGSMYKNEQGKALYHNLRAEAWCKAAKILSSGVLDEESNTLCVCENMYQQLETELTFPNYKFMGTKILIESKKDLKSAKRMGKSPDHADTYIIALWAWDQIEYADPDDAMDKIGYKENKTRKNRERNPMRM